MINSIHLTNGTLNATNGGAFVFTGSNNNLLTDITYNGALDLTNGGRIRTFDSFTFNNIASLDNNAFLTFESDESFGGASTDITLGATGLNRLNVEGNHTLTLNAGTLIHGESGRIGGAGLRRRHERAGQ